MILKYLKKTVHKSDSKIKPRKIQYIEDGNTFKIVIDTLHKITFDEIKKDLYKQYQDYGFSDVVVDKDTWWMIKKEDNDDAYIAITLVKDEYRVESFNTKKPTLSIIQTKL